MLFDHKEYTPLQAGIAKSSNAQAKSRVIKLVVICALVNNLPKKYPFPA